MNIRHLYILLLCSLLACNRAPEQQNSKYSDFIDPFICTGGDHGQTDPSANVPFGMIKPGPDTKPGSHCGYDFNATQFLGFSQNRASGVGCKGVGGNLRIFPFLNVAETFAEMDKTSEQAKAGYYSVRLKNGILCEATAGRTSGMYRFVFPDAKEVGLRFNFRSTYSEFVDEQHDLVDNHILKGWIQCKENCELGKYKFYYYLDLGTESTLVTDSAGIMNLTFGSGHKAEMVLKIALSSVSIQDAEENLQAETSGKTFAQLKREAQDLWQSYCDRVQVKTSNDTLKTLFYTHLYHASQTPFNIAGHSGAFGGSDGKVYQSENGSYYSGWSLWDTFRTKLPLLSIVDPARYTDMMSSMFQLYEQGKSDNPTDNESFIQIRNEHTIPVLLDAQRKNLLKESLIEILPKMELEAQNLAVNSPDKMLETCYDWWALSEIAGDAGEKDLQEQFRQKAYSFVDVWNAKFRDITDKSDIMHGDGLYEGTLWQYRWFVPFDFNWVIQSIGSKEKTLSQLDYFFENHLFNIGNQPDIHVPFLYYELGQPWKSQKLVREILLQPTVNFYGTHKKWETPYIGKVFKNTPDGYIEEMDDDAGTMSAWFVLASMGFYPKLIGEPAYWILPPIFDEVSIQLTNGSSFKIENIKKSEKDIYIQKAILNGTEMNRSWLNYDEIMKGGVLKLILGDQPNMNKF